MQCMRCLSPQRGCKREKKTNFCLLWKQKNWCERILFLLLPLLDYGIFDYGIAIATSARQHIKRHYHFHMTSEYKRKIPLSYTHIHTQTHTPVIQRGVRPCVKRESFKWRWKRRKKNRRISVHSNGCLDSLLLRTLTHPFSSRASRKTHCDVLERVISLMTHTRCTLTDVMTVGMAGWVELAEEYSWKTAWCHAVCTACWILICNSPLAIFSLPHAKTCNFPRELVSYVWFQCSFQHWMN